MSDPDRSWVGEVWSRLDVPAQAGDGLIKLLVPEVGCCRVFAAKSRETGFEALILDRLDIPREVLGTLPAGAGFAVELEPSIGPVSRMILRLLDAAYRDLFRHLCDDLVLHLASARDGAHASSILVERLARWQAFLRRAGAKGLSREEQIGLVGELMFLRDELLPRMTPRAAVAGWTGPERGAHDWEFEGFGFEVKATTAQEPVSVGITNISQLDPCGLPNLYLVVVWLAKGPGPGETLPDLVAAVRTAVGSDASLAVEDKLLASGYADSDADHYRAEHYELRSLSYYAVTAGFPKIVSQDVPNGVVAVRYEIALPSIAPFVREPDAAYSAGENPGGQS